MRTQLRQPLGAALLEGTLYDEQIELERRMLGDGVDRYRKLVEQAKQRGETCQLKPVERLAAFWFERLEAEILSVKRSTAAGESDRGRAVYGPVLKLLPAGKLAAITLNHALCRVLSDGGSSDWVAIADEVGLAVKAELGMLSLKATDRERWDELVSRFKRLNVSHVNRWASRAQIPEKLDKTVRIQVGTCLLNSMRFGCPLPTRGEEFQTAFRRTNRRDGNQITAMFTTDDEILDLIEKGIEARAFHRPCYRPMIVPPVLWMTPKRDDANADNTHSQRIEGGYLRLRTALMVKMNPEQRAFLEAAELSPIYDAVNALGQVPLRINKPLLAVAGEIWRTGGGELGIPHLNNLTPPTHPSGYDGSVQKGRWDHVPPDEKERYKAESARVIEENTRRRSARQEFLNAFDIAEEYKDYGRIFFPPEADFRWRFYSTPRHLHYQGDDLRRALLQFARYRPPNPTDPRDRGMFALKVNAANCFGMDKLPFSERVQWADDHRAEIERAAKDPLDDGWWRTADKGRKPFRFLAACMALADPLGSGAHAIVQRDGTCNGLQHYAALTRDEETAPLVNLTPGERPNSVYKDIFAEVKQALIDDARAGHRLANAILLFADVSLIKQVVMTKFYDVTKSGARDQVAAALARLGVQTGDAPRYKGDPGASIVNAAMYLTDLTMHAVAKLCRRASEVMEWLKDCAREIVALGESVRWTNPDGLPVVQPHRQEGIVRIHTAVAQLSVAYDDAKAKVKAQDQIRAVAPDMVHSLDACHLHRVARRSAQDRFDLATCHDGFGSHAVSYDTLGATLAEEFAGLHERPILSNVWQEWQRTYQIRLPEPPQPGTFDIREVLKATYPFS